MSQKTYDPEKIPQTMRGEDVARYLAAALGLKEEKIREAIGTQSAYESMQHSSFVKNMIEFNKRRTDDGAGPLDYELLSIEAEAHYESKATYGKGGHHRNAWSHSRLF